MDHHPVAHSRPGETALAFAIFTLAILSVALVPIRADNDCWWHVKTGQYLLEHGLPKYDVFAFTASEIEWHNHEWLAQIAFAAVFNAGEATGFGGWRALILAIAVMLWAAYAMLFWLARRLTGNAWLALLIVILAIGVGRRTFYPRPPVISYVLMVGLMLLLLAYQEGWLRRRRWLAGLLPLFAVWSNTHGAWMAGLVIVGAYALQDWWRAVPVRFRSFFHEPEPILSPGRWFLLLGGIVLATGANPYLWELYLLPARVLSEPGLVRGIGELRSPDFYFALHFEAAILVLLVLGMIARRGRPCVAELFLVLFFAHQAFQHVRHLTLFSLVMVPLLARYAKAAWDAAHEDLAESGRESTTLSGWTHVGQVGLRLGLPVAALVCTAVLLLNPRESVSYPARNVQYLSGMGYVREAFPSAPADLIELADFKGRMFNQNYYAGYLIWRLAPERHQVFTDSRFDIFGAKFLDDENAIATGAEFAYEDLMRDALNPPQPPLWQALLDQWQVQWILTRAETGLSARLREAAGRGEAASAPWVSVAYWPEPAAVRHVGWQIWIRNTHENKPMIDRARRVAPTLGARP